VRLLRLAIFPLAPASIVLALLVAAARKEAWGLELRGNLLEPGRRILDGLSPYEPEKLRLAYEQGSHGTLQALYPAPVHVLAAPLALLPFQVAMALFLAASVVAIVLALRLLGVTDWRCYWLAFMSPPVYQALKLGALTPLVVLLLAAGYRYRGGVAPALATAFRVFPWPMLLFAERRLRAIALTAAFVLGGWAAIGFADITRYPRMLIELNRMESAQGYSLVAVLSRFTGAAHWLAPALGLAVLALALRRRSYGLGVVATLLLTPIAWLSYFVLLLIPIALVAPTLSAAWFIPLLFWLAPAEDIPTHDWQLVVTCAALALTAAVAAGGRDWGWYVAVRARLPQTQRRQEGTAIT
jgi:hypothetical protein